MRCVVIVINRIIQTYTCTAAVIARSAKRDAAISRKGRRTTRTRISSNSCPQWLTAEKSSATETKAIIHPLPQIFARRGSLPLRCGGSPFLFPHGGGSRRKSRFESVVKRGGVAVPDDFGNLFDRIIGTADKSRGVIEFRVAHDVGKSFSE